jgi:hypothetical protein
LWGEAAALVVDFDANDLWDDASPHADGRWRFRVGVDDGVGHDF